MTLRRLSVSSEAIHFPRLVVAGLAAGVWVLVSGLLMAASFGYREMRAAFDAVGLPIPAGAGPFVLHSVVRLTTGIALVALFAILLRALSPTRALLAAAGFTWLLGVALPFAVVAQWGLFSWSLAAKLWAWGAAELLVAATIARFLYA